MTDDCSTQDIFQERGISFFKLEELEECLMKKKIGSGRKRLVNVEIVCFPRIIEKMKQSLNLQTEYGQIDNP